MNIAMTILAVFLIGFGLGWINGVRLRKSDRNENLSIRAAEALYNQRRSQGNFFGW